MTTKECLEEIEKEYALADTALATVPKDEYLKLRAAMVPMQELQTAVRVIKRMEAKKIYS